MRPVTLRAELVPKKPLDPSDYPVYRIRLWIEGDLCHIRSVEYSLHPEYKGITRRAGRGFDQNQNRPFSTYVFTRDDYWVEAKLSTGRRCQGDVADRCSNSKQQCYGSRL